MDKTFVGRQPIFDRSLDPVGYELLFRSSAYGGADFSDGSAATSQVIVETFTSGDLEVVLGGLPGFVNFTRELLLERVAFALPPERLVIEVLEDIQPDPEILEALGELVDGGYTVALDDFADDGTRQELVEIAAIAKLDIQALGTAGLEQRVARLRGSGLDLVAEKIETLEEFRLCEALDFQYFQGYFLFKPETVRRQGVAVGHAETLYLLARLQDRDAAVEELAQLTTRDIGLSYRLLRVVNSAEFGLSRPVESVEDAIVFLGRSQVSLWVSLLTFASVENKPAYLTGAALARGRLCELIGKERGESRGSVLFTVGLFSLLDAVLDAPMVEILAELPLHDELASALLRQDGPLGEALRLAISVERGELDGLGEGPPDGEDLSRCYLDALKWAETTTKLLAESG